ncbi:Uncharacterised protein [Mycobacteroides abscessus subsp. massiliense]|nr:Uncharacterised protein [Mycobacteroides abscessus subsp. massiliense]
MGTSFQPAHAGQANSDVTYSCSRPDTYDLSLGDLPSGHAAAEHYKAQRQEAVNALTKIRDHYQGHADHFIATEMLFRNTEERNAGRINPYKDGTATVGY